MTTKAPHHQRHSSFLPIVTVSSLLLLAASVAAPTARAQSAPAFALSDGVGAPASGSYAAGASFTLAVTFTTPTASSGYSLWFDTATATASRFSITQFTLTSTSFPDATSGGGAQAFNTANAGRPGFLSNLNDLGATTTSGTTVPAGSYAVENVSFLIDPATAAGTYMIQTTPAASGGRASGGSDAAFNFSAAPSAVYTLTVVPEPSTWALLLAASATTGVTLALRRRRQRA